MPSLRWLARLFHRDRLERELDAELRYHFDRQVQDNVRDGLSETEARRRARIELGGLDQTKEACRDARGTMWIESTAQDVRYAVRQLRRSPTFTLAALLTLAIGIGANTAVFTLVRGVLLRSLPVTQPAQLYKFGEGYTCCVTGGFQGSWSIFPYPFYTDARDHTPAFVMLAAASTVRPAFSVRRIGTDTPAESFHGEFVSGNYFSTLGVSAAAGRLLDPSDDRIGAAPVAVASYRTWQRYGLDPTLIGHPLIVGDRPVVLVGVAPRGFFGDRLDSDPPDFWMPIAVAAAQDLALMRSPTEAWLYLIGRLRDGAAPVQVQARLTADLREYLLRPGHANESREKVASQRIVLAPAGGGINAMRERYEEGLLLLMAIAAVVLIIACANLANLLLARGAAGRLRTAIELATGASRARIVRRYLTESVVLALLGGAIGLALSTYASKALLLVAFSGSTDAPIATGPSMIVLLFTFVLSLVTAIVFGVGPAWIASRADPADALRGTSRLAGWRATRPQTSSFRRRSR